MTKEFVEPHGAPAWEKQNEPPLARKIFRATVQMGVNDVFKNFRIQHHPQQGNNNNQSQNNNNNQQQSSSNNNKH